MKKTEEEKMAEAVLINKAVFCMDDEEFYEEMLETYLEDSEEVVGLMEEAYEKGDLALYAT